MNCFCCNVKRETRGKIYATLIIAMITVLSVLFGVLLFELPWAEAPPILSKVRDYDGDGNISSMDKALHVLNMYPVVDGHNDFPFNVRKLFQNQLSKVNFSSNLSEVEPWASYSESHTDIPRLRQGHVGGVFWVAYTPCETQGKDSVIQTFEQIELIHRLVEEYSNDLILVTNAGELGNAKKQGKIASLIGVEGGHSISSSPAILRTLYRLGARYMTLTHQCNTPWADSSLVDNKENPMSSSNQNGLSDFGQELIDEMNRIGMMVDLSHVSEAAMITALNRSVAPVIFSHSGAKAICDHHRNVADDILLMLKENGGIIMINFYPKFVNCNNSRNATLKDVADHIDHVRNLIGAEHVGLGTDYDGVPSTTEGLEDVSKFPDLFVELVDRGWSLKELSKLSFRNIHRVMRRVELVRDQLASKNSTRTMETVLSNAVVKEKNLTVEIETSGSLRNLIDKVAETKAPESTTNGNMASSRSPTTIPSLIMSDFTGKLEEDSVIPEELNESESESTAAGITTEAIDYLAVDQLDEAKQ
ncbi:unnamed protein product [Orchesella dallaii]|uniref:Dipeptidase n=1 Tax=Orchesella dallaii TaxID=48710 RepID=A0ABP1RJZ3_9HEXA